MKIKPTILTAAIITLLCSLPAFADVKIKSKQTMGGQTYENTTFIKGKRQRTETMNGMMVNITQCDLRRGIQINPNTQTYILNPFTVNEPTTGTAVTSSAKSETRSGGIVTTTVNIKDTGERKQMFGFTARHLVITMQMESSPDACNRSAFKMVTDGWYIDFESQFDCGESASYSAYGGSSKPSCQDKYVTKNTGAGKRGYPVYEKMTMYDESGKETTSYTNEVVELSKATLDATLFDIPLGFREVSDASQMYAVNPASSRTDASYVSTGSSSVISNAANTATVSMPSTVGPKKAGTIRIGIAGVKTGAVGDGITASDLAAAIQNTLASYLKLPNVEIVAIDARLDSAVAAEAREKECDYVLQSTVSHKKGGGGFGGFGKSLGMAVGSVGLGHTGSVAGNVAGQIATRAIVASTVSSQVKSKDEITLDVKLTNAGGASSLAQVYKAKAKSNGDDIISKVVEQAAQAIADTAK